MNRCVLALLSLSVSVAVAGPIAPVRSTMFSANAPCGPSWDPYAKQGIWFTDLSASVANACQWELFDDDAELHDACFNGLRKGVQ